jgi:hypothetical protein
MTTTGTIDLDSGAAYFTIDPDALSGSGLHAGALLP